MLSLFGCCVSQQVQDTGVFPTEPIPTFHTLSNIPAKNDNKMMVNKVSSSSQQKSSGHRCITRISAITAPNSPDSYQDIFPYMTSSSSSCSGPELYVDDEDSSDVTDHLVRQRLALLRSCCRSTNDNDDLLSLLSHKSLQTDTPVGKDIVNDDTSDLSTIGSTRTLVDAKALIQSERSMKSCFSAFHCKRKNEGFDGTVITDEISCTDEMTNSSEHVTDNYVIMEVKSTTITTGTTITNKEQKGDQKTTKNPILYTSLTQLQCSDVKVKVDGERDKSQCTNETLYPNDLCHGVPLSVTFPTLFDSEYDVSNQMHAYTSNKSTISQSTSCSDVKKQQQQQQFLIDSTTMEERVLFHTKESSKVIVHHNRKPSGLISLHPKDFVTLKTNIEQDSPMNKSSELFQDNQIQCVTVSSSNDRQSKSEHIFFDFDLDQYSTRSISLKKSRVVPIGSWFSDIHSSTSTPLLVTKQRKPVQSQTIQIYQNYVNVYKVHVASRKAKLATYVRLEI